MHYDCLIVDDEKELADITAEYLEMFGVTCVVVTSAAECEEFLENHTIGLLLLDINLKEESGFALCKKIRAQSELPILFISARQSDDDILMALNIGGDDYMRKPYSLSVLLAKIRVMQRRMGSIAKAEPTTDGERPTDEGGAVRLLPATMRVIVHDREIQLKAREFKLFKCLFDHRNTIVSKEQLFNTVWGNNYFSDSTLNVHIRRLREKIEVDPNNPVLIKTIWGTGYICEIVD
ncbi:MAG: response regulator transcription factor [Lachnospiraceae bacterium]|jgi:two-component system response regulator RegX3|nr:response regulator transcription factor [Lachnospiraceae bacterium]